MQCPECGQETVDDTAQLTGIGRCSNCGHVYDITEGYNDYDDEDDNNSH